MRSKSPAFPQCASGYHPAPPPPADPASAPKQGGVGLRGTTLGYLFAGAELTRSCCIIYHGSFQQGTALAPSLPCGRGSQPAVHTSHSSPPPLPGRVAPTSAEGKAGAAPLSGPAAGVAAPRASAWPRLTLIRSTAASSFSCSTSRCMVLRLPPDDIPEPQGGRRGCSGQAARF